jgi:hypothetical protein
VFEFLKLAGVAFSHELLIDASAASRWFRRRIIVRRKTERAARPRSVVGTAVATCSRAAFSPRNPSVTGVSATPKPVSRQTFARHDIFWFELPSDVYLRELNLSIDRTTNGRDYLTVRRIGERMP